MRNATRDAPMKRASRFEIPFSNAGQRDALAAGDPRRFRAVQTPGSIGNPGLSPPGACSVGSSFACLFVPLFLTGQLLQRTVADLLAPVGQMRRVQALAAQQLAD